MYYQMLLATDSTQTLSLVKSDFFSFYRGDLFIALCNRGQSSGTYYVLQISQHPYYEGQKICSLYVKHWKYL